MVEATPGGPLGPLISVGRDSTGILNHSPQMQQIPSHERQIDHFVATHWHGDHYAGASRLSQRIPIKNFYDHGLPSESDYASKADLKGEKPVIEQYLKAAQGVTKTLNPGDTVPVRQAPGSPSLTVKCLAAAGKFLPTSESLSPNQSCENKVSKPPDKTDNAQSVVLLLTYGDFSFLDPGDLTWEMEAKLLECPDCHSRMRILAAIHPPYAIQKILSCLSLPPRPPPVALALPDCQMDETYAS